MGKLLLTLICFLHSISIQAKSEELMRNLISRMQSLPSHKGSLIKSFNNHSQSYIYDQALAIIAFTKNNRKQEARKLLQGLRSLQQEDGSLYFSYYLNGVSPYPTEGDRRIAGAISWVALAAIHYQNNFNSEEFKKFNFKILNYLKKEMTSITIKNEKFKAVRFAPKDIENTSFEENNVIALEHNLDAYAAFINYDRVNKSEMWNSEISSLKEFILSMWDKKRSHFWSGAMIKEAQIAKDELYLDNQTWSLLALDEEILNKLETEKALDLNCDFFQKNHEGIQGFMDSKPTNRISKHSFVWSEGTLGQILAMKKISRLKKESILCHNLTANDFLESIKKMKKSDGGIAYATQSQNPDFTTSSSVAGTAWLYFAVNDINPFELN